MSRFDGLDPQATGNGGRAAEAYPPLDRAVNAPGVYSGSNSTADILKKVQGRLTDD